LSLLQTAGWWWRLSAILLEAPSVYVDTAYSIQSVGWGWC
jgi:hypothetical protein